MTEDYSGASRPALYSTFDGIQQYTKVRMVRYEYLHYVLNSEWRSSSFVIFSCRVKYLSQDLKPRPIISGRVYDLIILYCNEYE